MGKRRGGARGGGDGIRALLDEARTNTSYTLPAERSFDAEWVRRMIVSGQYTRERACDTKARFRCYDHAAKARGDIMARPTFEGAGLVIYPCPFCAGFHFASEREVKEEDVPAIARRRLNEIHQTARRPASGESVPDGVRTNERG